MTEVCRGQRRRRLLHPLLQRCTAGQRLKLATFRNGNFHLGGEQGLIQVQCSVESDAGETDSDARETTKPTLSVAAVELPWRREESTTW